MPVSSRVLCVAADPIRPPRRLHVAGVKKDNIIGERPEPNVADFSYTRLANLDMSRAASAARSTLPGREHRNDGHECDNGEQNVMTPTSNYIDHDKTPTIVRQL